MDNRINMEENREFLEFFKTHVDPNDQLPVKVPGYNLIESEITGEVINWTQLYLLQMKCPQAFLAPIINEVLEETRKSYQKNPKQCGFDAYACNPLKLSTIVISHTNIICNRLLDNAELNDILLKSSAPVLVHTPNHYVKAIKNTRRKMEDRHICISDYNGLFAIKDVEPTSFFGVFDGHGGQDAAIFAAAHLSYNIANSVEYPHNIDGAIREAFKKTDEGFISKCDKHAIYSGTTALVCIYRAIEKRLSVGWVGDSQALLACEGKVCQIVSPHVPSLKSERDRIEKMGGVIINWDGSYRVNGQLAISRAIGDASHKPFITSDPDTSTVSLDGGEDFLIIASDGLWEALSEDDIALFVYREISKNPDCAHSVVDKLVETAKTRTSDNITVIIVFFKDPHLIAKSTWLNKMEATYNSNGSHHAFENETSHFKYSNDAEECTISTNMSLKNNVNEDHQMIPPCELIEQNSNDTPVKTNSAETQIGNLLVPSHHFEDDFGPETDVDAVDEANISKRITISSVETLSDNFTNVVEQTSLENKIIQQLSEQHKDFLTDTNPFSDDHSQPIEEQQLEQPIGQKYEAFDDESAVIDNKIIDALEKLKCENDNAKLENQCFDNNTSRSLQADVTEKIDYSHEKNEATQKTDEPIDDKNVSDPNAKHGSSLVESAHTPAIDDKAYVAASAGEESEEEEEWNYYQGNKNQDQQYHVNVKTPLENAEDLTSNPQDPLEPAVLEQAPENSHFGAESPEETSEQQNISNQKTQFEEIARKNSPTVYATEEAEVKLKEESLFSEGQVVESESPSPRSVSRSSTCKELDFETEGNLLDSEVLCAPLPVDESPEVNKLETVIDRTHPSERPDSLNFEMASKLNPEAKEFVPIGSPTRSNPTSPVTDCSKPLQNAYLILSDDAVIAQSPKKSNTTMDNVDVPAEDDFKHGMDNRPHEFEEVSEYPNGNGKEDSVHGICSPTAEPSYQELNLKEAMQSDEKLDYEYKDVQHALNEDTPMDDFENGKIINFLGKENNAMNMSFYEGRDEISLTSNCDELNKVQLLPDIDEPVEKNDTANKNEPELNASNGIVEELAAAERLLPQIALEEDNFMNERPASSILAAASQVVEDVTALVDQMQLDAMDVIDTLLETDSFPVVEKSEIEKIETNNILLHDIDQQSQPVKQIEKTESLICVDQQPLLETALLNVSNSVITVVENIEVNTNIESPLDPNTEKNTPSNFQEAIIHPVAAESYDAVSLVTEESLQQEVVTENEFITDESVLNVPSPSQAATTPEVEIVGAASELGTELNEDAISAPILSVSENTDNLLPLETMPDRVLEQNESVRPVVPDLKKGSASPIKVVSAKDSSKPLATSKTKPTSGGLALKPSTAKASAATSKVSTKSPAKPTTTTDTKIAPTAASRMSVASKTTSKPLTTGATGNRMSMVNKTTGEKKIVPPVKKAPISGTTTTRTSLAPPPAKNTAASKSTTGTGSNDITNSFVTKTAPTTTNKTGILKGPAASTRTAKPNSATARTTAILSSTVLAKPRTMPSKPIGTTPTSATMTTTLTASKTGLTSSTTAKRTNRVQTGSQRTVSSVTTITTTSGVKSSATASATLTVTKANSTSVASAGLRKSGVLPNQKTTSVSSVTKTVKVSTAATTKTAIATKKAASVKHHNDAKKLLLDDTKNLLDLDKQQKNDNNQLITKNGIETQMIVIDSAAD